MRCEICGQSIEEGKSEKTKIDGSVMEVCPDCSKFGVVQKTPKPKYVPVKNKKDSRVSGSDRPRRTPRPMYSLDEPTEELVEDFARIVRESRESKGLSREVLGEKIYEKVSVINRIESGKMAPDIKLAKKLEKALNITLIEKISNMELEDFKNKSAGGPTLGDIVKIKKK
jgi:putative transcription factor